MEKAKDAVKVGIVGCGVISGAYLKVAQRLEMIDVIAVADIVEDRARARAEEFGIPKACSVDELMADPDVEIVINLTIPAAHHEVAMRAVHAGKSVYNEKPLTAELEEGRELLAAAKERGVLVGCAPDTFFGAALQTSRKVIDDGWIGRPIAANAFVMFHGHEVWHPDPAFYYQPGGGPMFDMGPYYLTALVHLLGPMTKVTATVRTTFSERIITSQPKYGQRIPVNTPTHFAGLIDFENGAAASITTSFDVWHHNIPCIEIYGTEGSLSVPDPNHFTGEVRVRRAGAEDWSLMPLTHTYHENMRGIGVADMAYALRSGRPHRANGEMAFHVLEAMHAFHEASERGVHIGLTSRCQQPDPLPQGLLFGQLDR